MTRVLYEVAQEDRSWILTSGGRRGGDFDSRETALDTAVGLAAEAYAVGHDAAVLVRDEDGVREVWAQSRAGGE